MVPTYLPSDFRDFLKSLKDHRVEYLLIGGFAVAFHGFPRSTADMDVWIARSPENAEKIVLALRQFGFNLPELAPNLFQEKDQIIRMGIPPLRIEIWTSISGVDFDECYFSRITNLWDQVEVDIINLEHLKINKKSSGRLKDLNDLENLP
jgi:hypothetical protein